MLVEYENIPEGKIFRVVSPSQRASAFKNFNRFCQMALYQFARAAITKYHKWGGLNRN